MTKYIISIHGKPVTLLVKREARSAHIAIDSGSVETHDIIVYDNGKIVVKELIWKEVEPVK